MVDVVVGYDCSSSVPAADDSKLHCEILSLLPYRLQFMVVLQARESHLDMERYPNFHIQNLFNQPGNKKSLSWVIFIDLVAQV